MKKTITTLLLTVLLGLSNVSAFETKTYNNEYELKCREALLEQSTNSKNKLVNVSEKMQKRIKKIIPKIDAKYSDQKIYALNNKIISLLAKTSKNSKKYNLYTYLLVVLDDIIDNSLFTEDYIKGECALVTKPLNAEGKAGLSYIIETAKDKKEKNEILKDKKAITTKDKKNLKKTFIADDSREVSLKEHKKWLEENKETFRKIDNISEKQNLFRKNIRVNNPSEEEYQEAHRNDLKKVELINTIPRPKKITNSAYNKLDISDKIRYKVLRTLRAEQFQGKKIKGTEDSYEYNLNSVYAKKLLDTTTQSKLKKELGMISSDFKESLSNGIKESAEFSKNISSPIVTKRFINSIYEKNIGLNIKNKKHNGNILYKEDKLLSLMSRDMKYDLGFTNNENIKYNNLQKIFKDLYTKKREITRNRNINPLWREDISMIDRKIEKNRGEIVLLLKTKYDRKNICNESYSIIRDKDSFEQVPLRSNIYKDIDTIEMAGYSMNCKLLVIYPELDISMNELKSMSKSKKISILKKGIKYNPNAGFYKMYNRSEKSKQEDYQIALKMLKLFYSN